MNNTRNIDAMASSDVEPLALIRLITPDRLEIIHRHARTTYPQECCGMIMASGIVRPCRNAQDELHRLDPHDFPRTSLNAYCFDVEDQIFLCRSLESNDLVRIIYHSHPDAPPEFSASDRRGASMDGGALYPGLGFLVIQCTKNRAGPSRLFVGSGVSFNHVGSWPDHIL